MHAVDKETLQSEGLSVLHFFIKQLVVSPLSTKYVISQAFALMPFLEQCQAHTSFHMNKNELRNVVDGLNHESLNVRYMADVTTLISGEAGSDLNVGCIEQSRTTVGQRLKLVCADYLGELGAVDPTTVRGITCERFKIE
ncbi:hypothetical protein MKW92_002027 [Papaver armeniacum]|nr:hypothetical protein MKW92_002027 [Papaver armeniacum]